MKPLLQHIFNILLLSLFCQIAVAQADADTTALEIKAGPGIYIDYGKLLTIPTDFETKFEAGLSFRLKNRLSPNVQAGMGKLEPGGAINNGTYLAEGWYGRIGINYLVPLNNKSMLYAGAKYSMSRFDESGSYEIGSNLWDNYKDGFSREGLQADWFEVILGSETMLDDHWSAGGYFSLRILNQRDEFSPIDTYAIPGYGRAFDKTTPAVNVYIRFSL
ncbi:hypothetical protein JMN32_10690 [Fulvivirga sp. 29W222]|uniref:Outer membrane protein beta-barrel domain-containing protein n=1 Tax=Fulvivirga marina TaxID=2494733 RepID=A0A937FYG1_9BACT|nr:DUF6048 family protein [Fulvivirga marina]MBL6446781.1 hypothetical protein [Fulvivirga marina]